ncbi:cell division cycle and apoptosis regulator protein 1 isoform X2 [Austrofundulus limnaeus]|uniref:Cell division cycle and apoptosis regulator protein 1 n=1 Tax=Austrofundulus limnaeus TaxID=52670 RepID=A0A2I4CIR1_AUSLI|nr:PREDICTED: cell division cycle and apoptosis regulator protein 1 isoform X2 [Austrofundulus limnaeus]
MAQFGGQKNPPWATQFAATAVSQPGHSGQSLDLNSLHSLGVQQPSLLGASPSVYSQQSALAAASLSNQSAANYQLSQQTAALQQQAAAAAAAALQQSQINTALQQYQQQQQQQQQPPQQPPQQQLYNVPHQLPQPQQALISQPPVALPTSLSLSNPQQTAQITVSYPTSRSSHQQQPQKQRVFTGVVNKLHDTFGFVDEDVFFQLSAVKGKTPQVGDRVLVEAVYNPNMPFKWNAQRIQTLPQLANQSHQQQPPPLPQASPQLSSLYNEPGMQLRYTDMHSSADNRQNSQPQAPNMIKPTPAMLQSLPPPTTLSFPPQAPPPSLLQAQLSAASLTPLLQNPPQPLLPQPPPKDVFPGGLLQAPVRIMPQPPPVRRLEPPPRFPTRTDRGPELLLRVKDERSRDRDRERRRSRERSPTRKRSRDRSPRRERSPRRPRRAVPRYTIQFSKFSLDSPSCDLIELRTRYQSLYIPSDFYNAVFTWVDAFPLTRPFQISNACNFHILHKEVDPLVKNTAVLDPPDVNHTYSAKVMLLANPSLEELYHKSCALAEDPQEVRESFQHPARLIKFLVGMRGKDEAMAIGGHWSPSLDGEDPEKDPSVLIKTAIRCCKALTGIDLSLCTQWYRFAEIRYHRPEETHKGRTVPAHVETVVLFLPDVWHCLPTRSEWEVLSRRLREQLSEKLSAERKEADGEQEEEEKDEDESKDVSTPTHWAKLDPKSMKVNDLRKELDCRALSSKGLKSQLIARLTKQLKVEEQVEESKEPEIPESKVIEEEEPVRSEDDREEDERKRMEEIERQRRERRYILPEESTILVHPNWAAKNGKFDCSVMSLSVLLDYRMEDNKEHSFEVSLFAELFNEMLQRDFGYRIYKALAALPAKDEKKEKKVKKESEKKESEKREVKDKEEEGEEPATKKTKEDEDEKRKEDSRDDEENEDESSTTNAEEYDPMEAEDADDDEDDGDDDDSNDRDRKDRRDDHRSSKERSSKDKEKKQMVTHNRELLMAFVYFDQCHCGYLQERDLEIIMYTLGLHLSRSQVKKLLNKPLVRETCYYRKLTDRGKDEPTPAFNEAQIENLTGNRGLIPALKACAQTEASESSNLIVYNGAMVDIGSMMQKLERSEREREEIEQRLMTQDVKKEESAKVIAELEQANKTLTTELEEVKSTLSQTEETLSTVQEQKTIYYDLMNKSATSLMSTVKGLMEVLNEDQEVEESGVEATNDQTGTSQTNGANE